MAARSLSDCVGSAVDRRSQGYRGDAARRGGRMGLDRRTFVRLVGTAAAAWPHAACNPAPWWPKASGKGSDPVRRPDPAVKRPVIGYLSGWSAEESRPILAPFHPGLEGDRDGEGV